ncbi:MAG TPA: hypothetical protein VJ825_00545 [Gemmatimonadaceae bacterium]|nr:hypothetical protein [Gemmatimonadaceae bacterium]
MNRALTVTAGVIAAAMVAACGSETTAPGVSAAGSYVATQFITTGSSGQTNQLLAGSTVNLVLAENGTTSGHLHLVASPGTAAMDVDLAGTWTQHGMSVDLSLAADTFVEDLPFTLTPRAADGWDLVADAVFAGTRVQLTLTQGGSI